MIGGLLKSSSRFAIVAAAGLFAGGVALAPAKAADLGGDCCADLEERVADLEATTVRKGNRRVSLRLSGHVNRAVMWFNDGQESNVYSVDNDNSNTRIRLEGSAKIRNDMSAGFYIEWAMQTASSYGVTQVEDDNNALGIAGALANTFAIRHAYWWIKHDRLGELHVGQTTTASKDITLIDLGGIGVAAIADTALLGGSLFLRRSDLPGSLGLTTGGALGGGATSVAVNWRTFLEGGVNAWSGSRLDTVKYVSPTFAGFTFSAAWAEDDFWDVGLRYAGEFNGVRIAAGIGYFEDRDEEPDTTLDDGSRRLKELKGSASIWHVPSGLFVSAAFGHREFGGTDATMIRTNQGPNFDPARVANRPDQDFWWVAAGVNKNFFGIGNTSLYVEYSETRDTQAGRQLDLSGRDATGAVVGGLQRFNVLSDSTTMWGAGIVQNIDAAAMELYLSYRHFDVNVTGCQGTVNLQWRDCTAAGSGPVIKAPLDGLDVVTAGARIRF